MNQRKTALLSGWSLIVIAILAGFSIGYALPEFNQAENIEDLKELFQTRQRLYVAMLLGLFLIVLLDLVVSIMLYKYFKKISKKYALIAAISRILYTLIFSIAIYFLILNAANEDLSNPQINQNFRLFEAIWNGGLVIFGVHLSLIGYLMMWENTIPRPLVFLALFAGLSYVGVHSLKLYSAHLPFLANLEIGLAFPMALGELAFAVWLVAKGGKPSKVPSLQ
ncbi:DUF4386 domain-containing protein [Algoriphagus sp.]|uniref:DUF4386 domain-containing protein n=1 Tax=Algoriphagus sp. TaxID=1872435 RepID=UPI002609C878|nr:DUF4386 domain-containing protein [Algoriphagus sp.]